MHDDPEKHLVKEVEVIQGALPLLIRTKEQIVEQIRCVESSPFLTFCEVLSLAVSLLLLPESRYYGPAPCRSHSNQFLN